MLAENRIDNYFINRKARNSTKNVYEQTRHFKKMDLDFYIEEKFSDGNFKHIEGLKQFIEKDIRDFLEEYYLYSELMNEDEFNSLVKYWPESLYDSAWSYIENMMNIDVEHILKHYKDIVGSLNDLRDRIEHNFEDGNYLLYLVREALATILLKKYQQLKEWQSKFGCEHRFAIDMFEKAEKGIRPLLEGWSKGEYTTLSDMSTFYGCDLSSTVEIPASTQNVFGYAAEKWDRELWEMEKEERVRELDKKKIISNYSEKAKKTMYNDVFIPQFVPDMIIFEGVFSRWKMFNDIRNNLIKEKMLYIDRLNQFKPPIEEYIKFIIGVLNKATNEKEIALALVDYETWSNEEAIMKLLKEEYLYRYCQLPYSLPIPERYFSIKRDMLASKRVIRIKFIIPGICDGKREEREVINKVYKFPSIHDIKEIQKILLDIVDTIKGYLCGMEKKGNKRAIEGMYPRKYHATHGLQYTKIFEQMDDERAIEILTAQSLYAIKTAIKYSNNPSLSSSMGNDSTFALWLQRKVTPRIDIAFNYTGVNMGEAAEVRKKIIEQWGVDRKDIKILKTKTSYWNIIDEYGWNFEVKGRRKKEGKFKGSVSEVCCSRLKHIPMYEGIKKYGWDMNITGLRAEEGRNRELAGKRDGLFYLAKSWGVFRCNPILFWEDRLIWKVVHKEKIPYAAIYDMKTTYKDEKGNIQTYKPRLGCWCCLLRADKGYLRWLKEHKRKQFDFLMKEKGLGELLFRLYTGLEVDYTEKDQLLNVK